jgi:hypothetical protein
LVLLVLVLLTIFGITSATTTDTEFKVINGERNYIENFYVADSAWKEGGPWLEDRETPPDEINTDDDDIVRNFGGGGEDEDNEDLADGTEDGTIDKIPYWYNITYEEDKLVPGSGPDYRSFLYTSEANADRSVEIEVKLSKTYKTGY